MRTQTILQQTPFESDSDYGTYMEELDEEVEYILQAAIEI
jgi:hypothetical protein